MYVKTRGGGQKFHALSRGDAAPAHSSLTLVAQKTTTGPSQAATTSVRVISCSSALMAPAISIVVGSPTFRIGRRADFSSADSHNGTSFLRMADHIPHSYEFPPPGVLTGVGLTPTGEAPGRGLALVESEMEGG